MTYHLSVTENMKVIDTIEKTRWHLFYSVDVLHGNIKCSLSQSNMHHFSCLGIFYTPKYFLKNCIVVH